MKKYTVVYGDFFQCGSHTNQIVRYQVIECEPTKLKDTVEELIGWSSVHFVFDGECKQTNDGIDKQ